MDKKKLPYKIIVDFYNYSSKECTSADKHNEKLYKNSLSIANKGLKKLKSGGIDITLDIESPPSPNNYLNYVEWKKKNVERPVEKQSIAVEFLCLRGMKIGVDYESYQAVDIMNKIVNNTNNDVECERSNKFLIDDKKLSSNLNDNHNLREEIESNNFRRRKSIHLRNTNMYPRLSLSLDNISIVDDNEKLENDNKNITISSFNNEYNMQNPSLGNTSNINHMSAMNYSQHSSQNFNKPSAPKFNQHSVPNFNQHYNLNYSQPSAPPPPFLIEK